MNTPMRRIDRQVSGKHALEILNNGLYGVLSLCSSSGEPYGVPMNYVLKGSCIYFHCAAQGLKLDLLKENTGASFCVVGMAETIPDKFSTRYESVIASGNVSVIEGEEKKEALMLFVHKYSPDFEREGREYIDRDERITTVIKLSACHIAGKSRK
ncbi:MAG: pyridoxamine 5'-phosphate oxidase family protein [Brevinematales bacterium]